MKCKKRQGFTIIESIIYIFLSVIILVEGLNIFIHMYKNYVEIKENTVRCNEYRNFYINLNNLISEGSIEEIIVGEDYITLCKSSHEKNLKKTIRVYDKKIVAVYSDGDEILTYNNMLFDVKSIDVSKKKNIIYVKIYDENGDEFICCI